VSRSTWVESALRRAKPKRRVSPNVEDSHRDLCTYRSVFLSIVAVHGLGSTPDWAWIWSGDDKKVHVNWLADEILLPAKLHNSRIMTFNYESKWLLGAPKQRRSLCAIQLLTHLDNKRKEVTTPSSQRFAPMTLNADRRRIRRRIRNIGR
jgi:hypothetical protein